MVVSALVLAGALVAVGGWAVSSSLSASAPGVAVHNCLEELACYTPQQFRLAYGVQPLLDRGTDGRGETVVLLEQDVTTHAAPPKVTDIRQDLARFDGLFGLPVAKLQVVNRLARSPSPWLAGEEEVEDTEIVHAVAPGAEIREILVSASDAASPAATVKYGMAALRLGVTEGAVISVSSAKGESCFTPAEIDEQDAALRAARDRHVTVVVSSGDSGVVSRPCPGAAAGSAPVAGVNLLAADPLVLGAGGTSLQASRTTGAYLGETTWNTPPDPPARPGSDASGGGFSKVFPRPAYQDGIAGIGAFRGVPDVAADAAANTGMALATADGGQDYVVVSADGTSASAPFWAGVIALADQYAGRHLGFVNPAIYRVGRSSAYKKAFHEVTTGTNTVVFPGQTITGYRAGPGGTRSPAGAAPTRRCSSRCWLGTTVPEPTGAVASPLCCNKVGGRFRHSRVAERFDTSVAHLGPRSCPCRVPGARPSRRVHVGPGQPDPPAHPHACGDRSGPLPLLCLRSVPRRRLCRNAPPAEAPVTAAQPPTSAGRPFGTPGQGSGLPTCSGRKPPGRRPGQNTGATWRPLPGRGHGPRGTRRPQRQP